MCMSQGSDLSVNSTQGEPTFSKIGFVKQVGRLLCSPNEREHDLKTPKGLDELDVVHVVNYDLPNGIDSKEHRTSLRRASLLSDL